MSYAAPRIVALLSPHRAAPRLRALLASAWLALGVLLAGPSSAADYRSIDWRDLVPDDLPADASPSVDHGGDPFDPANQSLAPEVLERTLVRELDGAGVQLAGFVVPLNMNRQDRVDEFLLVPYFGACVHVPPPPPNQIVHIRFPKGLDPTKLYEPFTVRGPLQVGGIDSALAQAGYRMQAEQVELYQY